MLGIDQIACDTGLLQQLINRNSVHAGGLHCDSVDATSEEPDDQGVQIGRKGGERPHHLFITIGRHGGDNHLAADIQTGGVGMDAGEILHLTPLCACSCGNHYTPPIHESGETGASPITRKTSLAIGVIGESSQMPPVQKAYVIRDHVAAWARWLQTTHGSELLAQWHYSRRHG